MRREAVFVRRRTQPAIVKEYECSLEALVMTSAARIAIIDRDDGARRSLAFFLAAAGLKTRCFDNLLAFKNTPWIGLSVIALLDISPTDQTALEILGAIRVVRPDLSLILMSGRGSFPPSDSAATSGAIAVLEKPFDPDDLLPLIGPALRKLDPGRHVR